jgi:hypothetical protein
MTDEAYRDKMFSPSKRPSTRLREGVADDRSSRRSQSSLALPMKMRTYAQDRLRPSPQPLYARFSGVSPVGQRSLSARG